MNKRIRWLFDELDAWVNEGIIEDHHAEAIRARYPTSEEGLSWGRIVFGAAGSILIGLGVILFFAFNWSAMPKIAKLAVIFTALIASHGAALMMKRPALRETLHVLGTMFFGSGIWLVAQIYHLEEHYPNGVFVWALGALALAWVLPSVPQAMMASFLLLLWQWFEAMTFHTPLFFAPLIVLLGTVPLAVLQRSRVLTAAGLLSFILSLMFMFQAGYAFLNIPTFLSLAAVLTAAGMVLERRDREAALAPVFLFFGRALFYPLLLALTFGSVGRELAGSLRVWQQGAWYYGLTAVAALLWALALSPFGDLRSRLSLNQRYDYLTIPVVTVLTFLIDLRTFDPSSIVPRLSYHLLFLGSTALMMVRGFRTSRARPAIVGCLFLSAYAIARYTDLFYSLLARSAVFLVMGAALIGVGYFFTRRRDAEKEVAQ